MSRVTIPIAIAIAIAALAIAPTATAQPVDPPGVEQSSIGLAGSPTWADLESNTAEEGSESGGFDWEDAAIGALSALLVLGAGVAAIHRHRGERGSAIAG